jgi:WD40 repeat protein
MKSSKVRKVIDFRFGLFMVVLCLAATLQAQTQPRLVLPVGHTGSISTATFSPDGKYVLTGSDDATARIYEAATGREMHVLIGHKSKITVATYSPCGKYVLTGSGDTTARIYEASTGKEMQVLTGHTGWINTATYSPDGKYVLTGSDDKTARIYEAATGREMHVLKGHTWSISSATYSPDGKYVLTGSGDKTARIYEAATGREMQVLTGHTGGIPAATYSPCGKYVLTGSVDTTARIYEAATGREMHMLTGHTGWINTATYSPDGKFVLTGSFDKTARIYEAASGREIHVLKGHTMEISTATYSPDGKYVLTGSGDETARIYEAATGREMHVLTGHTDWIGTATYSPDGKYVLTGSVDKTARIYEAATGREMHVLKGHTWYINTATYSPCGKYVLTGSGDTTARIYEAATGREMHVLTGHTSGITAATYSPCGKYVLTGSGDETARIYEAATGREMHVLTGHTYWITAATYSPDGKYVLTGSFDKTARIYEAATGREIHVLTGHTDGISTATYSPDGKYVLTASWDTIARIYESATGREMQVLTGHSNVIYSATYSPAGKYVLTSGDETARIYEAATGIEMHVLTGHTDGISTAIYSPDGKFVLTGSRDKTARIYEAATGREIHVLKGHTDGINTAIYSPDGKTITTTGDDHKTILWDAATGKPLYTRLQLTGNDWLVYDEDYRFDGTEGAINYLYFVCGLEVVELAQLKDSLWVPGLAEKIMKGEEILINDKPAPKLKNLNICEFTPVIESPKEDGKKLRYRIVPRRGGLGITEVIINGNPTYSYAPNQLERKIEDDKEVFYLNLNTDTLQDYLTASTGATNPLQVKAAVKGSGIYGRGQLFELFKSTGTGERPKFYGVFVGVNDYGNPQGANNANRYRDLTFAKKDAGDMADAVEACARNLFDKDSCFIYRLNGIANTAPTKDNLQRVLSEIGKKARASDVLYIFFAGHGDLLETDGSIRFLLQNAEKRNLKSGSFGREDLTDWCHPRKIKAQKRVFVFDACHSGQFMNEIYAAVQGRGEDNEGKRIRQLDKLKDQNGMMILAASAENESAYEDETLNQGVLTYHLLQAMKTQSKDTTLTVRTWFDETIDLVKDYSRQNGQQQEPRSFGDGYFFIGNVNKAVRDSIRITKPKIRIGYCTFSAVDDKIEQRYPMLEKKVNNYFSSVSRSGQLVYSVRNEGVCKVTGNYSLAGSKLKVRYSVVQNEKKLGNAVELQFKKGSTEDEVAKQIVQSIEKEMDARLKP